MDNIPIKSVKSHKHLGITLSEDLSWAQHIENVAVSANKSLDIFNALKFKLDRKSLEKLYFAYIRPKLEYASIVWDNCPNYLLDMLDGVQMRAAKIISGAISRTSTALIYSELGWETLGERRKNQRLSTMYKINHEMTPSYMSDPLPQQNNQAGYELRNSTAIPGIITRTSLFQNSFFPQTIKDWNNLDLEVHQAPSILSFKSKLKKKKDTNHDPPDWFYCGECRFEIDHSCG